MITGASLKELEHMYLLQTMLTMASGADMYVRTYIPYAAPYSPHSS